MPLIWAPKRVLTSSYCIPVYAKLAIAQLVRALTANQEIQGSVPDLVECWVTFFHHCRGQQLRTHLFGPLNVLGFAIILCRDTSTKGSVVLKYS